MSLERLGTLWLAEDWEEGTSSVVLGQGGGQW